MTPANCKNCDTPIDGNYCSHCGQSAHAHAINWHYVWHEIEHGIFHVDKGLFFTIKELFLRPGKTIHNFIAGKRIHYFKPAAMVFLLASMYGFLYHYFHLDTKMYSLGLMENAPEAAKAQDMTMRWTMSHYSLVILLMIPLYSFGSYITFKKSGYNYVEHLVINSFMAGLKLVFQLAMFPLVYYYSSSKAISALLTATYLFDVAITVWVYAAVFTRFTIIGRFLRTLLSYLVVMVTSVLIGAIAGVILKLLKII